MTPELGIAAQLPIRQLFPAVAAPLHDSDVSAETREVVEETQQILSRHKRCRFFALGLCRFYP